MKDLNCSSFFLTTFPIVIVCFLVVGNLEAFDLEQSTNSSSQVSNHTFYNTEVDSTSPSPRVSPCGNWIPYKDEKCIKILDQMLSYNNALAACRRIEPSSSLISIYSPEEYKFMKKIIFISNDEVDSVWLDARFVVKEKKFRWTNGLDLKYSKWKVGSPENSNKKQCVQMTPDNNKTSEWEDVRCIKRNLVVCERLQKWSYTFFQQNFLVSRKALQDSIQENMNNLTKLIESEQKNLINSRINPLRDEIQNVKNQLTITKNQLTQTIESVRVNSVPVGFLYVQLPGEAAPFSVFKYGNWTDVSNAYAGVFFRVIGDGSDDFGRVQTENAPHLHSVQYKKQNCNDGVTTNIYLGGWSGYGLTGTFMGGWSKNCVRYNMTGGEVRPRNMAIKVWKRTA